MPQFYVDGYRPGDPFVAEPHPSAAGRPSSVPQTADVLVVGCGPAGLVLAAQLANLPDIDTVVVDRRDGPLEVGQADGVACRTVEMFEAFGLADRLIGEGYQVNEVAFWRPAPEDPGRITRTARIPDVEDGLSEMPHMIVNQARMLAYLRDHMARSPRRTEPYYGLHLTGVDVEESAEYPVTATLAHVVDGARTGEVSTVRAAVANRILHPYTLEVRDVGWWSVYEIGQRLCARFDDVPDDEPDRLPRVFIAGDACHTHNAKAGQGMNVSMADTWNLGWKLGAVLRGTAGPELLRTYSEERQEVARQLIDFDREFAALFSAAPDAGPDPEGFQRYFRDQGRFTAGVAVRYGPSMITAAEPAQHLARGFAVGTRFHSAPVVRLADAKPLHLGHVARADGAWRLYVFADRRGDALRRLCDHLASPASPLRRHTPAGAEPDSVIDVRAVFGRHHHALEITDMPEVLLPRKGRFGLVDHEKVFCPDPDTADVFDERGVDRESGCVVVVVRPDQYVAHVLGLDDHDGLDAFLAGVLVDAR